MGVEVLGLDDLVGFRVDVAVDLGLAVHPDAHGGQALAERLRAVVDGLHEDRAGLVYEADAVADLDARDHAALESVLVVPARLDDPGPGSVDVAILVAAVLGENRLHRGEAVREGRGIGEAGRDDPGARGVDVAP